MVSNSACEKHLGGRRVRDSTIDMQRFKTGDEGLSFGPPSSARNVEGAGPTNMLVDLPSKKSQLDLRPFGVGVPAVGHTVMP